MIDLNQIQQLREETAAPVGECRKALEQSKGDIAKAKEFLRKWGKTLAEKKVERETKQGIIDAYLHPNKQLGVILELRCESDFVAKSPDFLNLAHELCLQIAAANPLFVGEENLPEDFIDKEKQLYKEQFALLNKPEKILAGMIEGKWQKRKQEICLLEQPWIKDESKKIKDLISETVAKLGENIVIRNFSRLSTR